MNDFTGVESKTELVTTSVRINVYNNRIITENAKSDKPQKSANVVSNNNNNMSHTSGHKSFMLMVYGAVISMMVTLIVIFVSLYVAKKRF